MSEEQQAQADKNTFDIRRLKNLVWIAGTLFTLGGIIWGLAVRTTNKDNADTAFKANETIFQADQKKQNEDIKKYIDQSNQRTRTKDSIDIVYGNGNLANQIKLLREECRRMMTESKLSRTLHYRFDNNGNRVVESEANK
jgi:hypothetical protein